MSEIRDFLKPMVVPQLQDSNFADKFDAFCQSIRDNINNIVSAPFLKGDRGSGITILEEPIRDDEGQWTEFAYRLVEAIYGISRNAVGFPLADNGMVLWEQGSDPTHKSNTIIPPDMESESTTPEEKAEYQVLLNLDGGIAPGLIYDFTAWDAPTGGEQISQGTAEIVKTGEDYITIKMIFSPLYPQWEGRTFNIEISSDDRHQLIDGDQTLEVWITMSSQATVIYHTSYEIFKDLESVPVCYSEHTGEKVFWAPFFFFDGRLNYVKTMPVETLSLFHDMSCVIWGDADFIPDNGQLTLDNLRDPDSWDWTMKRTYSLPKLYYDVQTEQFCWEVASTQTGIIAQGVKGDKGEDAHIWICVGTKVGDSQLSIDSVVSPAGHSKESIIQGDLCIVFYEDSTSTGVEQTGSWQDSDYNRCQFGTAHIAGTEVFIENHIDTELITKLRNSSFHDWLAHIGDTNLDPDVLAYCAALYSIERDQANTVMAMWAGKSAQHYLAPVSKSKMYQMGDDTGNDPVSGRTLNILYDKTRFPKNVRVEKEMASNQTRPLANPIQKIHDQYRLAAMCNVMNVIADEDMRASTLSKKYENGLVPVLSPGATLTEVTDSIFLNCELIIGWVPEKIAQAFNETSSTTPYQPMELYRAQKIHFWLRIPNESVAGDHAKIIFANDDGSISSQGSNSINIRENNAHKGSGRLFTLTTSSDLKYTEYVPKQRYNVVSTNYIHNHPGNTSELNFGSLGMVPGISFNGYPRYAVGATNWNYEYAITLDTEDNYPQVVQIFNLAKNAPATTEPALLSIHTKRYKLSGSLVLTSGAGSNQYSIANLLGFQGATPSYISEVQQAINWSDIAPCYPLSNKKHSFLGYLKTNNNSFITTTPNDWMRQGWVLESRFIDKYTNYSIQKDINRLYFINTTYYDTIYPSDYNFKVLKADGTGASGFNNAIVRIYPEGMTGLQYHRIDNMTSLTSSQDQNYQEDVHPDINS